MRRAGVVVAAYSIKEAVALADDAEAAGAEAAGADAGAGADSAPARQLDGSGLAGRVYESSLVPKKPQQVKLGFASLPKPAACPCR